MVDDLETRSQSISLLDRKPIGVGGASSRVYRETYSDGDTRITKAARSPQYDAMLRKEYEILEKLKGIPHIIPVVGTTDKYENFAFQMEDWGKGFTLEELVGDVVGDNRWTRVYLIEKMNTFCQIARAWQEAWNKGIAHNDLQLVNIMVFPSLKPGYPVRVALTDWGDAVEVEKQAEILGVNPEAAKQSLWIGEMKKWRQLLPHFFSQPDWVPQGLNNLIPDYDRRDNLDTAPSPSESLYEKAEEVMKRMDREKQQKGQLSEMSQIDSVVGRLYGQPKSLYTVVQEMST